MKLNYLIKKLPYLRPFSILPRRMESHGLSKLPIKRFILLLFSCCFSLFNNQLDAQEPLPGANGQTVITGTVMDFYTDMPLEGSNIRIGTLRAMTDRKGHFSLSGPFKNTELTVTHQGYRDTTISIPRKPVHLEVRMRAAQNRIEEIEVVSTGYQSIPRERATGSFSFVDSKTIQRNPGMNLLSRLNGVTNGLLIDRNTGNPDGLSVRGRSTIFSSTRPLIVVDNFPYEGDLDNINPNDIQSVTVLKDATAASIWGVRSGNGVIVVTTKKPMDRLSVELSSNFLFRKRPDLSTERWMSSSDFIDSEIFLFEKGYYDRDINVPYQQISPVVEILAQVRDGSLSELQGNSQIDGYRGQDVRADLEKYFYRDLFQHQQQFSVSSSTPSFRNILSGGIDRSISDRVGSENGRTSVRNASIWSLLKDRMTLNSEVWYVQRSSQVGNSQGYTPKYPYERLADGNGNALEASYGTSTLRRSYTDTAGSGYLLDWKYRPLDELRGSLSSSELSDKQLRFNFGIKGKLYRSLSLGISYLNSTNWQEGSVLYSKESFYVRNLVNQFSSFDPVNGAMVSPIPVGGILSRNGTRMGSQYGRAQADWNETIAGRHSISGLLGMEFRQDRRTFEDHGLLYGYDPVLENFSTVDIFTYFPLYHKGTYSRIANGGSRTRYVDNNRSFYGLVSYSYRGNLALNTSFRKDESNIFGVKANQKGVPLWSVGAAYSFHEAIGWKPLDMLKLRATYGYNGNIDKNTSAFLTSTLFRTLNPWGYPIDRILNPPNSTLRWERVRNVNIGLDFSLFGDRFGGSLEYYSKKGMDLMGNSPLAPQTGVTEFYGNVANTLTDGVDLQLRALWLERGGFGFRSDLIFNAVSDRVTKYLMDPGANRDIVFASGIVPLVGHPINSLVLFRSSGLDGNGDPVGWSDGGPSTEYSDILNGLDRTGITIMGSKVPTRFGSLRNTVSYRGAELSFQVLYKWGNFVRVNNSFSSNGLISGSYRFSDYASRWQEAGDEGSTDVPRFNYPMNANREDFYQSSEVLAIPGGTVRLQDVRLSYLVRPFIGRRNSALQLYVYASNLGLLWKQNDRELNPDLISGYRVPSEWSIGMKFNY